MQPNRLARNVAAFGLVVLLAACGGGGLFGGGSSQSNEAKREAAREQRAAIARARGEDPEERRTIWELFSYAKDPGVNVEVNKYLWNASLEVLNFLPIESVDPFTGVIVTGYGTPPGGGRSYRATVYVQDPALDARSLKVSLQTSGGGSASPETVKAVEDAILTRARQLRVRDSRL